MAIHVAERDLGYPFGIPFQDAVFSDKVFEQAPWYVVLGDPGSGKTTALKMLVLDYVQQAHLETRVRYTGIPIFVPLRDFTRARQGNNLGYSLLDFMYDQAKGSFSSSCSDGFFEHYLGKGECLICFDGLDEIPISAQRQEISNIVETFIRRYPKNRYVITSRVAGYEQAPISQRLFPHYEVQPLSDQDIGTYVHQWYQTREKSPIQAEKLANELVSAIMARKRVRDLAHNPLLLAIIALIHKVEA